MEDPDEIYQVCEELGSGSYGTVVRVGYLEDEVVKTRAKKIISGRDQYEVLQYL